MGISLLSHSATFVFSVLKLYIYSDIFCQSENPHDMWILLGRPQHFKSLLWYIKKSRHINIQTVLKLTVEVSCIDSSVALMGSGAFSQRNYHKGQSSHSETIGAFFKEQNLSFIFSKIAAKNKLKTRTRCNLVKFLSRSPKPYPLKVLL